MEKLPVMIVLAVAVVLFSVGPAMAWEPQYTTQYQVNHTNQFPAQNQFFIDDFNRLQRDYETQRMKEEIRRLKFDRELERMRNQPRLGE